MFIIASWKAVTTTSGLKRDGAVFWREKIHTVMYDGDYYLYPSIYNFRQCAITVSPLIRKRIIFGIYFFELHELAKRDDFDNGRLRDFLKCIADSTKMSILRMLKDGPLYGSQLAEKLGLTGATVSHHMNALFRLEIVIIHRENNKIFYHFNKEKTEEYLDNARKVLG